MPDSSGERGAELRRRARVDEQSEPRHLPCEERAVAGWRAVGDDPAPANHRLEARHSAGGVDEHVGRGEELAHLVGESEHRHAWLVGERQLEPLAVVLVAAGEADHDRARESERLADGAIEIADSPAASRHEHDSTGVRQAELATGCLRGRAG